jgi:nitroimidazol reductase NimA-like FMN-containing flavoprotein (pyridoxamine 5'-phosphate oxidase superfamily)
MYLFVVIFALASILQDQKIKDVISRHYNKTWKKFYNRVKKESEQELKIDEVSVVEQPFFGKD